MLHLISAAFATAALGLMSKHLPYRQDSYHCEHCRRLELHAVVRCLKPTHRVQSTEPLDTRLFRHNVIIFLWLMLTSKTNQQFYCDWSLGQKIIYHRTSSVWAGARLKQCLQDRKSVAVLIKLETHLTTFIHMFKPEYLTPHNL